MTDDRDEAVFLTQVKASLDAAEGNVDDITAARLRVLRREAVAVRRTKQRPIWLLPAAGLATAATVAMLAVTLWSVPPAIEEVAPLDDIALLSDTEALEFYKDLDFYLWLDHEQSES